MFNNVGYMQPPLHYKNRNGLRVLRMDGKEEEEEIRSAGKKLESFMSPHVSPTRPHLLSSHQLRQSPSPFHRTFGNEIREWESRGMPQSPAVTVVPPRTPAAAATNALTHDLLSITDGLQRRVEHATRDPTTSGPPGSPEAKFKQDLLQKIGYLTERFHQVAQVSTTLEKRVHDLQAYCKELEERLVVAAEVEKVQKEKVQKEKVQKEEVANMNTRVTAQPSEIATSLIDSLTHANGVLRTQLANAHDQLDQKDNRFNNIANATMDLSKRIESGETLLSNMHGMMGRLADELRREHSLRVQAEDSLLELQQQHEAEAVALATVRKRRQRRRGSSSLSRVDVAHYSADEAEEDEEETTAAASGTRATYDRPERSMTPMAQYEGAFENRDHFENYLKKLDAIRGKRDRERDAARAKRRSTRRAASSSLEPTNKMSSSHSRGFSPASSAASTTPVASSTLASTPSTATSPSPSPSPSLMSISLPPMSSATLQHNEQKQDQETTVHHRRYKSKEPSARRRLSQISVLDEPPPPVKSRVVGVNKIDDAIAAKRQLQAAATENVLTAVDSKHHRAQIERHDIIDPRRRSYHDDTSTALGDHRHEIETHDIISPTQHDSLPIPIVNPDSAAPSDPILPRELTPQKQSTLAVTPDFMNAENTIKRTDGTSSASALNATSLMKTPPLRQGGWSNLDVLDQVRDLHEHGVSMLERMNETSSEVGSEERRRAEADAHKLESQVDMLTRQYRDLLNSCTPSPLTPAAAAAALTADQRKMITSEEYA